MGEAKPRAVGAGTARLAWRSLAALLSLAPGHAAAAPAQTPDGVVAAVVRLDKGSTWAPLFAVKPTPLMLRYFTAAFNSSWANAMRHNQEEPVLDGDPLTGGQGITGMTLAAIKPGPVVGAATTVVATLAVRSEGVAKPVRQDVAFMLKRTGATWQIDDLSAPVDGTLRAHFRKAYGR